MRGCGSEEWAYPFVPSFGLTVSQFLFQSLSDDKKKDKLFREQFNVLDELCDIIANISMGDLMSIESVDSGKVNDLLRKRYVNAIYTLQPYYSYWKTNLGIN